MRKLFSRAWHSPTVTSWLGRLGQFARLLLVLPLVLKQFDEVELATWFLFSSILFFSILVVSQVALSFSRMIALASGGAADLSPIQSGERRGAAGNANWSLIFRLYRTVRSLNALSASVCLLVVLAMGYFSLGPMLENYEGARNIWWAFIVFAFGQYIRDLLQQYYIALRGLNKVALTNRWRLLVSLLSSFLGAIALYLGGGILCLSLVMQLVMLVGVLVNRILLYQTESRFRDVKGFGWDAAILGWAWTPFWKRFVQSLANRGGSRIAMVFLARSMEPVALSSVLIAMRFLNVLDDMATAPVSSNVPRLGRVLGAGRINQFRTELIRKYRLVDWLLVLGIGAIGAGAPAGLELIGSSKKFLPLTLFAGLAAVQFLATQVRHTLMISAIGNNIVSVYRFSFAALLSVLLSVFLIPLEPFWGFVIAAYVPLIIVANWQPLKHGCALMEVPIRLFVCKTTLFPWIVLGIVLLSFYCLPVEAFVARCVSLVQSLWRLVL